MNLLVAIAADSFLDPTIDSLPHAAHDAESFAKVLESLAYSADDRIVLTGTSATKTTIESKLRRLVKSLKADDALCLLWIGKGFAIDGLSYVACHDTDPDDPEGTSVALDSVLRQLQSAPCKQTLVLLDTSYGPLTDPATTNLEPCIEVQELAELLGEEPRVVVIGSAAAQELSLPLTATGHSLWMHHLLEAFAGKALPRKTKLTVAALLGYFSEQFPRTISTAFASKKSQNPWFLPKSTAKVLLADLAGASCENSDHAELSREQVRGIILQSKRPISVKGLSGYRKGMQIPDRASSSSQAFLFSLAKEEIEADLKAVFANLRQNFKFKRADIQLDNVGDGTGTITTPYFNYSIQLELEDGNTHVVIFHRLIDAIKDPDKIFSLPFAQVFQSTFDTAVIGVPETLDLEALVDRLEDLENDKIQLDYDPDLTSCTLRLAGVVGEIEITADAITIVNHRADAPRQLLRSFLDLQKLLTSSGSTPLLPFGDE